MTIWSSDLGWLEYLMSQLCSSMDGEMLSTGSIFRGLRRPNCYHLISNKFYLAAAIEAMNAIINGLSLDIISEDFFKKTLLKIVVFYSIFDLLGFYCLVFERSVVSFLLWEELTLFVLVFSKLLR